jgi:hypothetical protein
MILEGAGRQAEEDVNQPVVAHLREKGLLVAKSVSTDDLRRCVGYLDCREVFPRLEACPTQLDQPEPIAAAARALKNPTLPFWRRV